jgi:hypothetical protein
VGSAPESWPRGPTGAIAMITAPLDLADLVAELDR